MLSQQAIGALALDILWSCLLWFSLVYFSPVRRVWTLCCHSGLFSSFDPESRIHLDSPRAVLLKHSFWCVFMGIVMLRLQKAIEALQPQAETGCPPINFGSGSRASCDSYITTSSSLTVELLRRCRIPWELQQLQITWNIMRLNSRCPQALFPVQ